MRDIFIDGGMSYDEPFHTGSGGAPQRMSWCEGELPRSGFVQHLRISSWDKFVVSHDIKGFETTSNKLEVQLESERRINHQYSRRNFRLPAAPNCDIRACHPACRSTILPVMPQQVEVESG